MTEQDEMVRMTVAEIAVMREIVKWRKAEGVDFWRSRAPLGEWAEWHIRRDGKRLAVIVEHPKTSPVLGWGRDEYWVPITWEPGINTFTQAVDVIVALGFLPARFSSAYRAGWEEALEDERMKTDMEISDRVAPAAPAAWWRG
jgi:hypothetical protein